MSVDHGEIAVGRLQAAVETGDVGPVFQDANALYGIHRPGIWAGQVEALLQRLQRQDRAALRRAGKAVASATAEDRGQTERVRLDPRPEIRLGSETHLNVERAVEALSSRPGVFQRTGRLVRVVDGRVDELSAPALQVELSAVAEFTRLRSDPGEPGRMVPVGIEPPLPLARQVVDAGAYPGVRELVGITTIPVLRPDGSLVVEPGYDAETRLVYRPTGEPPAVPERPTRDHAVKAARTLLEVVDEFPFLAPADRSAWLALVLTLAARAAIRGAVPFFLVLANQPRVGKTNAAEHAGACAGVSLAPSKWPEGQGAAEELGKRVDGWVKGGAPGALLDNIRGPIGGTALEAAVTSYPFFQLRALGGSDMSLVPQLTTFAGTGNGAVLSGDMAGRTLPLRLFYDKPRPELRTFRRADLRAWVAERRSLLHAAALTIVSAYLRADCPDAPLELWGSFEAWTRVICGAIGWCELPDPRETRADLGRIDHSGDLHDRLLAFVSATLASSEWTAGDLGGKLAAEGMRADHDVGGGWLVRDARLLAAHLGVWDAAAKAVNARKLGEMLSRIVDRPALDGKRITYCLDPATGKRRTHRTRVALYTVEEA